MFRDGILKSIWQSEIFREEEINFKSQLYDVVIAGAGISGLSCAINLQQAGLNCLVVEAENLGFGTTGGTTAHLNTFFDASYDQVIRDFGLSNAKLLAQAGKNANNRIKTNVSQFQIDCDFSSRPGFLFATNEKQTDALDNIYSASTQVGIEMEYTQHIPFPIPFKKAVSVKDQAQFHPILYTSGLRDNFLELGGEYIRKCRVIAHEKSGDSLLVRTTLGEIQAKNLIYATHTPPGKNLLHFRNIPWRSYVMAVELAEGIYPTALGYDLEDIYHYYRSHQVDGKSYLIVGGKDHKTGSHTDTNDSFVQLEKHIRQFYKIKNVAYKWSSQYYEPVDGLPYIGRTPMGPDNVFVCTGYNGNGMIFGTLAGELIPDLILKNNSMYEELFDPRRIKPQAGFTKFITLNAHSASAWVQNKFAQVKAKNVEDLTEDKGELARIEKKPYAVYKETTGKVHAVSHSCTHMGCSVKWNNAEKTWDCPCHGSRFGINGNILNAPAVQPLEIKNPK